MYQNNLFVSLPSVLDLEVPVFGYDKALGCQKIWVQIFEILDSNPLDAILHIFASTLLKKGIF